MTSGLAPVGIRGTRSIPEGCVPPAFSSGWKPSAFLVRAGRLILIGMPSEREARDPPTVVVASHLGQVDCTS
jgi:hypothetical protein